MLARVAHATYVTMTKGTRAKRTTGAGRRRPKAAVDFKTVNAWLQRELIDAYQRQTAASEMLSVICARGAPTSSRIAANGELPPSDVERPTHLDSEQFRSAAWTCQPFYGRLRVRQTERMVWRLLPVSGKSARQ